MVNMKKFEMSEEQKKLFDALTTLQQEISLNSLSGMNDIDSYKASSGKAINENTMAANVCTILSNAKVVAFIDSMRVEVVNDAIMSREEMLEALTKLSRINVDELVAANLATLTEFKAGFDIKLKAAQGSMKQLAELNGYNSANKIDLSSSDGTMTPKNFNEFYGDDE